MSEMEKRRNFTIERTDARDEQIERLRALLIKSGRAVHMIHNQPTNAAIFDLALAELEKVLNADTPDTDA